MDVNIDEIKPIIYESGINVPYNWWAGDTASKFFISLRDDKKILGTKCNKCNKVFLPPRKVCHICFKQNTEWIEVSNIGTLTSFTIARKQLKSLKKKVPVILGLIQLDGADTSIIHYIENIEPEKVKIGIRVEAKFRDETKGNILDIECFKPI